MTEQELRDRCKTDLKFLVTKVLGMGRWNDELHGGLERVMNSPGDRKLILLPRGHQKSTIVSVCWVVQQLLKNPNETVSIYSATWKLSKDILHQIKNILTTSALKDIFGSFQSRDGRWTATEIDIAHKNFIQTKNPSISTGGLDAGKTGSHCSLMVMDDVVSPENTTTADLTRKTIEAYKDCLPLLDPGGRLVVIGTRYTQGDLYGDLLENEAKSVNGYVFKDEAERKQWRKFLDAAK